MHYFSLLTFALLCCFKSMAFATPHMDLQVKINMEKAQLEIEGNASQSIKLPKEALNVDQNGTHFRYDWPLPVTSDLHQWQGGGFVSGQNLYLPSNWYPEVADRFTYTLNIESPIISVAPGDITDETQTDTGYSARFTMTRPVEEIALFSGPYKITTQDYKGIHLRTYFYAGMEELSTPYIERTAQYLARFEEEIAPFPFAQFNIIAAPVPTGLAFAGSTYMGADVLRLPFIRESSLGHEILHSYWGNGVYPDYQTGNWAEGLTTYMADYRTAEIASSDKAKEMRLSWLRDYAALPKDQDTPVTSFVGKHGQASQVIGYHKVAFIFHMLRQTLGDEVFSQGIKTFWHDYAFQTASWQDLERVFSSRSQKDLSPFFTQWVKGVGAPEIKSISAVTQHQKNAGWDLKVTVVQGPPTFHTYLPLGVGTGNQVIQKTMTLNNRVSSATLSMQTNPYAISVDPDLNVFRRLSANEAPPILRDVMLSNSIELILIQADKPFQDQALELAQNMTHAAVKIAKNNDLPNQPFIMIAQENDILDRMNRWQIPAMPFAKNQEGTAHVWAGRLRQGTPYIIISLSKPTDLSAIKQALAHYGQRSGIIFKDSTAIYKTTAQPRTMSTPVY